LFIFLIIILLTDKISANVDPKPVSLPF